MLDRRLEFTSMLANRSVIQAINADAPVVSTGIELETGRYMDPFGQFKENQKQHWAQFAPFEVFTVPAAARLVSYAQVAEGHRVLDVACGTGVVAVTAARTGARVTALDLTSGLLERARANAHVAGVSVDFHEGDAEAMPFADSTFDVVMSQYGHMFAPRPDVVIREMLRVLKTGGRVTFSTWPPELLMSLAFSLVDRYMGRSPSVPPLALWGDPNVIQARLGGAVVDLTFDRARTWAPALSEAHLRHSFEVGLGPMIALVEALSQSDLTKLSSFRRDLDVLIGRFFDGNRVRLDYLLTCATKG